MKKWFLWVFLVGMVVFNPYQAAAQSQTFEVRVTNLTSNLVFTPILVASHREDVRLFDVEEAANPQLEALAEAGDVEPLTDLLEANPNVREVANSGAVLPPGMSTTVSVETIGQFDHVSVASMLIPTNDAFFAVNGMQGPQPNQTRTVMVPAWDAGTEANDELCVSIPGPPTVCMGEGVSPPADSDEGHIHIHRGVHGVGDLAFETYDWRNPVAKVTISRLP